MFELVKLLFDPCICICMISSHVLKELLDLLVAQSINAMGAHWLSGKGHIDSITLVALRII